MARTAVAPTRTVRTRRRSWSRFLGAATAYLYVLPALVLTAGVLLYPIGFTTVISLFHWDLLHPPGFVGLSNYVQLTRDPFLASSLINTLLWVAGTILLPVGLGLLFALILNRLPGQRIFKTVLFLPYVVAPAVVGLVWLFMYDPTQGILQALLGLVGQSNLMANVLSNSPSNTIAIIVAAAWRGLGINMVLFLVGLQSISPEVIEAAMLDGASGVRLFRHITFPLLKPLTTVVVTLAVAAGFTTFDFVWIMTGGGPYRSSETLAVTMYRVSFVDFNFGYGAAIAVVLALIVSVFAAVYLRNVVAS